eukprot:ANDGO_03839.mRNA.1 putative methionine--tRNA ligase
MPTLRVSNDPASVYVQLVLSQIPNADKSLSVESADVREPVLVVNEKVSITGSHAISTYFVTAFGSSLAGSNPNEEGQVWQWVSFCRAAKDKLGKADIFLLQSWLSKRIAMVGSSLSLADLAVFAAVFPAIDSMNDEDRFACCNVVRWFDYVQSFVKESNVCPFVQINKNYPVEIKPMVQAVKAPVPAKEDKRDTKKEEKKDVKKESAPPASGKPQVDAVAAAAAPAVLPAQPAAAVPEAKADDGKKKEKKEKTEKSAPAPVVEDAYEVDKMDIRIGRIVDVKKHPDAESLYVEQIDVGEEKPRTIVSGLVKFVPIEQMMNRLVVVICNLKPAKMRGIESFGMVMAASDDAHTIVVLPTVPDAAKPGERVSFEGFSGAADKQINSKKLEKLLSGFRTDAAGVPNYNGKPFTTSAGPIGACAIPNGNVR